MTPQSCSHIPMRTLFSNFCIYLSNIEQLVTMMISNSNFIVFLLLKRAVEVISGAEFRDQTQYRVESIES